MNFITESQNFAKAVLTDFAAKLFAEKGKIKKEGKAAKVKLTLEEMTGFIATFVGKPMAVSAEGKPVSLKKNGKPRKQSRWQKFLSAHKGEGLNKEELKALYAEEKKTMSGSESESDSKPKRVNGYNLFVKQNSAAVKAANPDSDVSVFTLLGAAWKEMSDDEKEVYKNKAASINAENLPEKAKKASKKAKKASKKAKKAKKLRIVKKPKSDDDMVITSGSEGEEEEKKALPTINEGDLDTLPLTQVINANAIAEIDELFTEKGKSDDDSDDSGDETE